ncbi:MAG: hypothetical protein AAF399_25875, partial [Bacteroidota bacterium]
LTPCNMHLGDLAKHATNGINKAGGKAVNFSTLGSTKLRIALPFVCLRVGSVYFGKLSTGASHNSLSVGSAARRDAHFGSK